MGARPIFALASLIDLSSHTPLLMKYSISFRRAARHRPSSSGSPVLASMNLSSSKPNRRAKESALFSEELSETVDDKPTLISEELSGESEREAMPA